MTYNNNIGIREVLIHSETFLGKRNTPNEQRQECIASVTEILTKEFINNLYGQKK